MGTRSASGRGLFRVTLLVVFAASAVVALTLAARTEEPTVTAAGPDQPTYRLSNFSFQYPFPASGSSEDSAPSPAFAGVTFRSEWVSDIFPGDAECQIILRGADGAVVASWYLLVTTLEPTAVQGPAPVEVAAPPISAAGSCGPAEAPSGHYQFADVAITDDPDTRQGPKIVGTILASGGVAGTQSCMAEVRLPNGSFGIHEFTLSAGDGSRLSVLLPPSLSEGISATVSCEPYTIPPA